MQEQRDQYGFLVVLPLYQGTELPPPADRQAQFEGILLGVFRVSDVVEEALQGLGAAVDFDLRDQNAEPEEQFLGRYDAAAETVIAVSSDRPVAQHRRTRALCPSPCTRTLEIGRRQWSVAFYPSDDYGLVLPYAHWGSLLTGLLLTGSLVLFLHNLQQDLEQTQALNELKLRFFSMASHELRTPLSTILLSAESLQLNFEAMPEAQKHKSLQRIHQTAQQMSQQVTDWLTLTRSEVGKLEFSPVLVEAIALCQQVIDEVQGGVSQTIVFEVDTQTLKAFWDPKLLRSLLSNLLSNGAKYSPPDSLIQVHLRSMATQAEIQVCDCGRGIPTADQAQIQDAFQRGSNVEEIAGTGLGLAIVQVCVELHRGQWQLLSKEGQGTTVVVTLPLE